VYRAAMLLQLPHRVIFDLQEGQLKTTVPAVFVVFLLHEMHVWSSIIKSVRALFIKIWVQF